MNQFVLVRGGFFLPHVYNIEHIGEGVNSLCQFVNINQWSKVGLTDVILMMRLSAFVTQSMA